MSTEKWYDSDDPVRWGWGVGRWTATIVLALALFGGLLTVAGWAFGIWTAPWAGRGNAYKQQQSSTNRIFAQQLFHDLYTDYQATVAKLPLYKQQATQGYAQQANYDGLVSHCLNVVGQYNSAAGKYLTKDFRDADLPITLNNAECNQ